MPEDVTWVKLPSAEWIIARNYADFVTIILSKGLPEFIAFDHDLSDEHYYPITILGINDIPYISYKEKTGFDCAKWLVDFCIMNNKKLPKYVVHSMNPIGKENIEKYLENFERVS
jgi:hypothetical protein